MRSARVLLALAAAGSAVMLGMAGCSDAAADSAGVWVSVSPSTVRRGSTVSVLARCGGQTGPATVSSPAFGTVTIQPVGGELSTTVQVPPTAEPGTSTVTMTCHTGATATTALTVDRPPTAVTNEPIVTNSDRPTMGPHTGGGFLASGDGGLNRVSLAWLALGVSAILAAAAVSVRSRRRHTTTRR
jgi:hypothetical protein